MTKIRCINDDCKWCNNWWHCGLEEIEINIDLKCTSYEPKEYEGDTSDDET